MYDAPYRGPSAPGASPPQGFVPPPQGWVPPGASPPGGPTVPHGRMPSGLFPGAGGRPTYRETLPARSGAMLAGAAASTIWMMLCGLITHTVRSYCWWTIGGGLVAWLAAIMLARGGDRGVAAGVAMAAGFGVAIAMSVALVRWTSGHWVLW